MATYQAIAAVSAAVRALLEHAVTSAVAGAEVRVVNSEGLHARPADGVTIYLHRVTANTMVRGAPGRHGRAGLALDLHYLITAWATDPIRQQSLLGWALRVLEDTAVLTAHALNEQAPGPDVFKADESVELVLEPLSIQDDTAIWNAAGARFETSASYIARGVRIDSL